MSELRTTDLAEYIRWVGAFDFDRLPFRETDAVILCILSYFDFSGMQKTAPEFRLESCLPEIEQHGLRLCTAGADAGNSEILEEAALSVRFGSLLVSNYTEEYRTEPALQFSAVCFTDPERFTFIAYRGTDSTIAGWKEDFMISFEKTEAQELALRYAAGVLSDCPERAVYLGGHSKGGNEALYAACMLPEELFSRVSKVFLLDAPGLCGEVMDISMIARVNPVAVRIIPEHSLIGKIYEPDIQPVHIVKSSGIGFLQHNPATWLVDHGELAETDKNTPGSDWLANLLNRWFDHIPAGKRPEFIDELFRTLEKQGKESLRSLKADDFLSALQSLAESSRETKQILLDLPKRAVFEDQRIPKRKAGGVIRKARENKLIQGILLITLGLVFVFTSGEILYFGSALLAVSVVAVQLFFTMRRLVRNHWKTGGLRNRFILLLVFAALFVVLLVKEEALFILGSMIFGILFLAIAFASLNSAKKADRNRFMKSLNIAEAAISFAFSVSFFIIPEGQLVVFETVVGITAAADGITRIIYDLVRRRKERQHRF